jgi:hypothetical protein
VEEVFKEHLLVGLGKGVFLAGAFILDERKL